MEEYVEIKVNLPTYSISSLFDFTIKSQYNRDGFLLNYLLEIYRIWGRFYRKTVYIFAQIIFA